jgi:hypothetical protein
LTDNSQSGLININVAARSTKNVIQNLDNGTKSARTTGSAALSLAVACTELGGKTQELAWLPEVIGTVQAHRDNA